MPGSFTVKMLDSAGEAENRAGSHPDRLQIDFALEGEGGDSSARDFVFELPPGFSGNPAAVPECPRALYEAGEEDCPPQTQVGLLEFVLSEGGGEAELPVFRVEPAAGEFLSFGSVPGFTAALTTELRPDDFGLTFKAGDLPKQALSEGRIELWGVPVDHQEGTTIARRPFLTTPTHCGSLPFTFRTRSWQEGAPWLSASTDTGAPLEGCEALRFDPRLALQLSNPVADSPTGMRMEVSAPENEDADGLADAQIENATIELPDGITVSPGGAQGLSACTDAQLDLESTDEASCPASSQVGTVELASPVLNSALTGSVYLGEERPGERFRLFIVAPGPGVVIKFVGALQPDPASGRLSATLAGLPQVTIRRLSLDLAGGPESLIASPLACGPATATGRFDPYSGGAAVDSSATVAIAARLPASQCPGSVPFAPKLAVRSSPPLAGQPTSLSASLLRQDGEQLPRRFAMTLPAGLSTALGTVRTCTEADVAAGVCPSESKVGSLLARAGSGPMPATLPGDVYLTGPYRRAPFGLLMQVRAAIGPFDLGTMAFRASATLNGRTGRVTIATDPLPEAIEGVPVRFQAIDLNMDRPGLVRNPTSCRAVGVDAVIESGSGASTTASGPLTLRGCKRLRFRPRFSVAFTGRKELHRGGNPGLRISARQRQGDTNLRAMKFSLPRATRFDIAGLKELCSRRDAIDNACPAGARVGTALARTSMLDEPLGGAVYVVQPADEGQPDLWVSLAAMGVRLSVSGQTSIEDGHLVTSLSGLPDLPLSTFTMRLREGGLLSLAAGPCRKDRPRRFTASFSAKGQNGSRLNSRLPIVAKARCRVGDEQRR